MRKVILSAILCVALSATTQVNAQTQKFGFVNVDKILDTIPQMDTLREALQVVKAEIYGSLQQSDNDIKKKFAEYQALSQGPQTAATAQKLEAMKTLIESMQNNLEIDQQQAQSALQQAQYALLSPITDYIQARIEEIAKRNAYSHVISSATTNMYYKSSDKDDMTDEIIKIMVTKAPKVTKKALTAPR